MKIAAIIARTLLGLIFVVFGLNAFFNFIPLPPPKGELAGEFMKALFVSHYLYAVKCFEISGGLLLLSGRFTALGLTLVGPVIVNILFFHAFLDPSGLPLGSRWLGSRCFCCGVTAARSPGCFRNERRRPKYSTLEARLNPGEFQRC